MSSLYHKAYLKLPPILRSFAASAYGAKLQSLRYGESTEKWVNQALERDQWSKAQWKNWEGEELPKYLEWAAHDVPYYREMWAMKKRNGDNSSPSYLENWPILEKNAVRENPEAFVADSSRHSRLYKFNTSGTTGKPIVMSISKVSLQHYYALFEARLRRWNNLTMHDRWAILGGQLIVPFAQKKPPYWVCNHAMNQLYMSTYHIDKNSASEYLKAMIDYKVKYIYCYPSSLNLLATHLRESESKKIKLKAIFTNAEPCTKSQKDNIEIKFGCRVIETYGMCEMTAAASTCAESTMHLWPEAGKVEIYRDEKIMDNGYGEIICTGMVNRDMPLIRYRVGDVGEIRDNNDCSCGRSLRQLERIEGRSSDMLIASNGRKIFWINPVFYGLPIVESQVIQESSSAIEVVIVKNDGFSDKDEYEIRERLKDRLGDMRINFMYKSRIERGANGKLKPVINRIKGN